MKKFEKHIQTILLILSIFIVLFIWGNSILPARISGAISEFVRRLLDNDLTSYTVRKTGHFTEFFALGAVWKSYLHLRFLKSERTERKVHALVAVLTGVLVPLIDETIQTFNDRGPMVKDIWIDISGYTCGCLIVIMLILIFYAVKKTRQKSSKSQAEE